MTLVLPDCLIVDCSHWQAPGSIDWEAAREHGNVRGAIVKLIQNGVPDPAHVQHLYDAYEAGIELLGIYDFGTASSDHQAFLIDALAEFQGNVATRLLAIDVERNPDSQMAVSEAEVWASGVYLAESRHPVVYIGRDGPDGQRTGLPSYVLSRCDLWLPKYGPEPDAAHLPPGFRLPTNDTERGGVLRLWQFTGDGINAPSVWPQGIPKGCDLSYAMGFSSFAALQAWWGT